MMDGYEYDAKVLWPKWNKDSAEQLARVKTRSASNNNNSGSSGDSHP
jgi:hypothetical protein